MVLYCVEPKKSANIFEFLFSPCIQLAVLIEIFVVLDLTVELRVVHHLVNHFIGKLMISEIIVSLDGTHSLASRRLVIIGKVDASLIGVSSKAIRQELTILS